MKEKRMEMLYYKLLDYISGLECGIGLYNSLHNFVGMTNEEIEETGYELEEYFQPDSAEQLAAASGKRYFTLEMLESQARVAVEVIIRNGISQASDDKWLLSFDKFCELTGLDLEGRLFFIQLIGGMLCERPEVAGLRIGTNQFDISFSSDCRQEEDRAIDPGRVPMQPAQMKM